MGLIKNTKKQKKLTKYVLLYTYYYKLISQKVLDTKMIYKKWFNNDDLIDGTKTVQKGSTMMVPK